MQSWVDRTDSAMDYTAYFRDGKASPAPDCKAQRYSCNMLRRNTMRPARVDRYLLASPAIPEESKDLSTVWP